MKEFVGMWPSKMLIMDTTRLGRKFGNSRKMLPVKGMRSNSKLEKGCIGLIVLN